MKHWLLAAGLVAGAALGCLDAVEPLPPTPAPAPAPPDPTPQPNPSPGHTDAEFWRALADRVAAGKVPSSDRLILILKEAKASGDIRNAERIAEVLPDIANQSEAITDTNRERIATALKKLTR